MAGAVLLMLREIGRSLKGVYRLLNWEADGLGCFTGTWGGFLRSFLVFFLLTPVRVLMVADQIRTLPPDEAHHLLDRRHLIMVQGASWLAGWVVYPLAIALVARWFGRQRQFFGYMTAYNWFQLTEPLFWGPLVLLVDLKISPDLVGVLWLFVHGALLGYAYFILRRAMDLPALTVAALVVIDFLLGTLIDSYADKVSGFIVG